MSITLLRTPLPAIVGQLYSLAERRSTRTADLAQLIRSDAALTARIMKIVRSGFYSDSDATIDNLNLVIVARGWSESRKLVVAISAITAFPPATDKEFDRLAFWEERVLAGLVAEYLARRLRECEQLLWRLGCEEFLASMMSGLVFPNMPKYQYAGKELDGIAELACWFAEHGARANTETTLINEILRHSAWENWRLRPDEKDKLIEEILEQVVDWNERAQNFVLKVIQG